MAGAGMNDIKSRIKSVNGTMQITKAMELVATSKLRRAKMKAEASRPFGEALSESLGSLLLCDDINCSEWSRVSDAQKTLFVVIAGDRGLAGGYNANIFRTVASLRTGNDVFLPIGKKSLEYFNHRGESVFSSLFFILNNLSYLS